MDILKFITAGSVDDGKSTLIGRLLYDSESILADQLEALHRSNRKNDDGSIDLAILTDGLKLNVNKVLLLTLPINTFKPKNANLLLRIHPAISSIPVTW